MENGADNKIYVTQPSLPPLDDFIPFLEDIWKRKWLTNDGFYHQEFERLLGEYLGVKHVSLFCNGMIALQVGLQALRVTGEVITTPFSFVATTHAIHWNECTPVFCDIEPKTYTLDAEKVESLITPHTTAILPVHVYGYPCDVLRLKKIADTYGLKLFYDAAHAFGVKLRKNCSILNFGDLSMLSFHATKVFNTFEGGALVTDDPNLKKRIDFLKNFGFAGQETVVAPGSNGKMNEFQAALGILQLKEFDACVSKRKAVAELYDAMLCNVKGISLPPHIGDVTYNYSYYPILVKGDEHSRRRDQIFEVLKDYNVMSRKYFYPLISSFPSYRHLPSAEPDRIPVATELAREILCLPIYSDLPVEKAKHVVVSLKKALAKASKQK